MGVGEGGVLESKYMRTITDWDSVTLVGKTSAILETVWVSGGGGGGGEGRR